MDRLRPAIVRRMKVKELRLDIEALLSQVIHGHGFLHYGYWPDGRADDVSLARLSQAQQAYFERMLAAIPADVGSILDVGSGTGSNARGLLDKGYHVDCVCPSARLNLIAARKLGARATIFECGFEELATERRYDLVLCCESFHYIRAGEGLRQAAKYGEKYLLIFDYFRTRDNGSEDRITHARFNAMVADSSFTVVHDEDVTAAIAPTFFVLDALKNDYLKPCAARLLREYRTQHPFYAFLLAGLLNRLERSAGKLANRHATFPVEHEYRLILLRKRGS